MPTSPIPVKKHHLMRDRRVVGLARCVDGTPDVRRKLRGVDYTKAFRLRGLGCTQKEIALVLGVTQAHINIIFAGKVRAALPFAPPGGLAPPPAPPPAAFAPWEGAITA